MKIGYRMAAAGSRGGDRFRDILLKRPLAGSWKDDPMMHEHDHDPSGFGGSRGGVRMFYLILLYTYVDGGDGMGRISPNSKISNHPQATEKAFDALVLALWQCVCVELCTLCALGDRG